MSSAQSYSVGCHSSLTRVTLESLDHDRVKLKSPATEYRTARTNTQAALLAMEPIRIANHLTVGDRHVRLDSEVDSMYAFKTYR